MNLTSRGWGKSVNGRLKACWRSKTSGVFGPDVRVRGSSVKADGHPPKRYFNIGILIPCRFAAAMASSYPASA